MLTMANLHSKNRTSEYRCYDHPPPSPPLSPPPTSSDQSFPSYLILMFCGLAVSFSFIFYLLFATYRRRRQRPRENIDETYNQEFMNEDNNLGPVIHYPIWVIDSIGLEKSQIESIQVFKYKRDEGLIEGITDCSVCLSEFEDDETLRLLPKCSHAFHVPCIDTWLRSHKNCPLCRASIIKNSSEQIDTAIDLNSIEPSTREEMETPVDVDLDSEDNIVDHHHHVVEIENSEELLEKTCRILDETRSRPRVFTDLADHHREEGEGLVAMRRSVSMDDNNIRLPDQEMPLTSQLEMSKKPIGVAKSGHKRKGWSSSFRIYSKAMTSSSFRHSLRKASSFANMCPHNRSY